MGIDSVIKEAVTQRGSYCLQPGINPVRCVPDGAGANVFRGKKTWSLVIDAAGEPVLKRAVNDADIGLLHSFGDLSLQSHE